MLKSFLIKLRRQPKVVRDQVAIIGAGVFTFFVFAAWAFTLPGQFGSDSETQTAGVVSSFKEALSEEKNPLSDFSENFNQLKSTPTEEVIENETETIVETNTAPTTSVIEIVPTTTVKEVRIITTSSSSNLQSEVE